MAIDILLRRVKEDLLRPFARWFGWLHPNHVTILAGLVGILCGWYAAQGQVRVSVALWLVNRVLDGLDGVIARVFNKSSDFGGYLDIVVDFLIYSVVPISIVISVPSNENWLSLAVLLATFFVNAAGLFHLSAILEKLNAGAKARGELTTVSFPPALIEGTETVVFFTLFLAFPQHISKLYYVFSAGVAFSIVQRVIWAALHLDQKSKPASKNASKTPKATPKNRKSSVRRKSSSSSTKAKSSGRARSRSRSRTRAKKATE